MKKMIAVVFYIFVLGTCVFSGCSVPSQNGDELNAGDLFSKDIITLQTKTLKKVREVRNSNNVQYIYANEKNTISVIFDNQPSWNGISLTDASGNTLSQASNLFLTKQGYSPSCDVWDVVIADLNNDKNPDFFVQIRCAGNGLNQKSQCILFLSDKTGYANIIYDTYKSDTNHIVKSFKTKKTYIVIEELIESDIPLPPLDENEFTEPYKHLLASGTKKTNMFFHVYYLLEIKGQNLLETVSGDDKNPVFVSYFKGDKWYGKNKTKLLTQEQQNSIWLTNYKGVTDIPIRKAFGK